MKRTLLIIIALAAATLTALAAPRDERTGKVSYEYTLERDGMMTCHIVKELADSTINVPYNPEYQELLISSQIALPDGGCIADYIIVSQSGFLPQLDVVIPLEEKWPISELSITITIPQDKNLIYSFEGTPTKPKESSADGARQYKWLFKNIPAIPQDEGNFRTAALAATTFESQDAALGYVTKQFSKASDLDSSIVAALKTGGSEISRIESVDRWLKDHIELVPSSLESDGYKLRNAASIVRSAYATVEEYAGLRAALLEAAGVKSTITADFGIEGAGLASLKSIKAEASSEKKISSVENTFSINMEFGKEDLKYGYRVVELPFAEGAFDGMPYAGFRPARSRDLLLGGPVSETYTYTIVLKDGVKVSGLGFIDEEISNKAGFYSCKAGLSGNVLTVVRSLDIYEGEIRAAEFADFHSLAAAWAAGSRIQLTTLTAE